VEPFRLRDPIRRALISSSGDDFLAYRNNHYILSINLDLHTAMLSWTLTFLVIAIIAGVLGFSGIAGTAAGMAKILFLIFLFLLVASVLAGLIRGRR